MGCTEIVRMKTTKPKKPQWDKRFPMPTTQTLADWQEYMMREAHEQELTKSLQDYDNLNNPTHYDSPYDPHHDAN